MRMIDIEAAIEVVAEVGVDSEEEEAVAAVEAEVNIVGGEVSIA